MRLTNRRVSFRVCSWIAVCVVTILSAVARADEPAKLQPPIDKPLRMFTCGHSFHAFVYVMMPELVKGARIEGFEGVGSSRIGGSRVIQHWDVADDKNEAKRLLKEGKIDVLTLSPIWLPDAGIENFVRLGLKHNPDMRITVQEYWLPNDTYEPVYPLQVRKPVDHNATSVKELARQQAAYDLDLGEQIRRLNREAGKQAVLLVPVGQAAIALRERIVAGTAPGMKQQSDLFRDTWGHATQPLQVLSVYTHFAVIYRRSPVGLPMLHQLEGAGLSAEDTEKLNTLLQELAWQAAVEHPLSGLTVEAK